MIVLGLGGAVSHDPAAALVVDGQIVAAAEEERFNRIKHAKRMPPEESARYCLAEAGLAPRDVQVVAYPYAPISLWGPARWHYAWRHLYAPDRAAVALLNGNRRYRHNRRHMFALLRKLGIDPDRTRWMPVEHHLAHASSAYHLSGYDTAAIMSIDGMGEYATTWFGYGEGGRIRRIHEFYLPDSLGGFYGAITEFLGFELLDGEYKVMGMAPYGDASRCDISGLVRYADGQLHVDNRYLNTVGLRRHRVAGLGATYSPRLIERWGPPRQGDSIDEPYVHIAAATQNLLEEAVLALSRHYLGDQLKRTHRLCFAGGVALNVKLNLRLMDEPDVGEMFVQPAASDAGTALGAATWAAHQCGDTVAPMTHVYLGPCASDREIADALAGSGLPHRRLDCVTEVVSDRLAAGDVVAWYQGRMEFGPRALGNRSILANPAVPGIADKINAQIKYRERWRPFCPSVLDRAAPDVLGSAHPSPFMTLAFRVADEWKSRIPEVVHVDGTARPQVVSQDTNPRYHDLLERFCAKTGLPVLLNTSLNRRGEPMCCTPRDAMNIFRGTDLQYLAIGDFLVHKTR